MRLRWMPTGDRRARVAERLFGDKQTRLFLRHGFFLYASTVRHLVRDNRYPPRLLLRMLFSSRTHLASDGLIWPKTGCASIA